MFVWSDGEDVDEKARRRARSAHRLGEFSRDGFTRRRNPTFSIAPPCEAVSIERPRAIGCGPLCQEGSSSPLGVSQLSRDRKY